MGQFGTLSYNERVPKLGELPVDATVKAIERTEQNYYANLDAYNKAIVETANLKVDDWNTPIVQQHLDTLKNDLTGLTEQGDLEFAGERVRNSVRNVASDDLLITAVDEHKQRQAIRDNVDKLYRDGKLSENAVWDYNEQLKGQPLTRDEKTGLVVNKMKPIKNAPTYVDLNVKLEEGIHKLESDKNTTIIGKDANGKDVNIRYNPDKSQYEYQAPDGVWVTSTHEFLSRDRIKQYIKDRIAATPEYKTFINYEGDINYRRKYTNEGQSLLTPDTYDAALADIQLKYNADDKQMSEFLTSQFGTDDINMIKTHVSPAAIDSVLKQAYVDKTYNDYYGSNQTLAFDKYNAIANPDSGYEERKKAKEATKKAAKDAYDYLNTRLNFNQVQATDLAGYYKYYTSEDNSKPAENYYKATTSLNALIKLDNDYINSAQNTINSDNANAQDKEAAKQQLYKYKMAAQSHNNELKKLEAFKQSIIPYNIEGYKNDTSNGMFTPKEVFDDIAMNDIKLQAAINNPTLGIQEVGTTTNDNSSDVKVNANTNIATFDYNGKTYQFEYKAFAKYQDGKAYRVTDDIQYKEKTELIERLGGRANNQKLADKLLNAEVKNRMDDITVAKYYDLAGTLPSSGKYEKTAMADYMNNYIKTNQSAFDVMIEKHDTGGGSKHLEWLSDAENVGEWTYTNKEGNDVTTKKDANYYFNLGSMQYKGSTKLTGSENRLAHVYMFYPPVYNSQTNKIEPTKSNAEEVIVYSKNDEIDGGIRNTMIDYLLSTGNTTKPVLAKADFTNQNAYLRNLYGVTASELSNMGVPDNEVLGAYSQATQSNIFDYVKSIADNYVESQTEEYRELDESGRTIIDPIQRKVLIDKDRYYDINFHNTYNTDGTINGRVYDVKRMVVDANGKDNIDMQDGKPITTSVNNYNDLEKLLTSDLYTFKSTGKALPLGKSNDSTSSINFNNGFGIKNLNGTWMQFPTVESSIDYVTNDYIYRIANGEHDAYSKYGDDMTLEEYINTYTTTDRSSYLQLLTMNGKYNAQSKFKEVYDNDLETLVNLQFQKEQREYYNANKDKIQDYIKRLVNNK